MEGGLFSSRSFNRALPWIAGAVLLLGVLAFWQTQVRTNDTPETFSNEPATTNPRRKPSERGCFGIIEDLGLDAYGLEYQDLDPNRGPDPEDTPPIPVETELAHQGSTRFGSFSPRSTNPATFVSH